MNASDLQRGVVASFARGDTDGLFSLYDESCVIREAPTLPSGGEFVGKQGLRELRSSDGRVIDQMSFYWDTQMINNGA